MRLDNILITKSYKLPSGGQIVIILLLIMVVALAVALSLVGRTIVEISNSTDTESSSRAFSAAEAGIEKAIKDYETVGSSAVDRSLSLKNDVLTNRSTAEVNLNQGLPKTGVALEYPPFGKESFSQFWLASPSNLAPFYSAESFDVYFGTPADYSANPAEQPAITILSIYVTPSGFRSKMLYYDSYTVGDESVVSSRNDSFKACLERSNTGISIVTNEYTSASRSFYCRVRVNNYKEVGSTPILLRIKFTYTSSAHPLAVQPAAGASLPAQINIYNSVGVSGSVQRNIKVFKQDNVMPFFFDYVIFSAGDLSK